MYKILGILCIFLLVQEEETITWEKTQKLHWGNFKDEPDYDSDAVAITASGITYGFRSKTYSNSDKIEYSTNVIAQFYPNQSWYLRDRVNDTVLGHEQLHFDITELHARKLRKRFKNVKSTKNIQQELSKIYDQVNKELQEMQNAYDNGSDYSRDYEGQIKWQKFIASELKKYSQYKQPTKQND
ncbi:DUF922 domain-containing protein [Kordia algicida OT-1]|uniref:DUF922 domain-containing protein n=1 Tax=Kordia algicida OT-1 TaxID=391587 RepID=A9E2S3_9FLAO|nr:DUF922 domain-containing protein [Kordia algicida]EDP95424.1 hypothetical protein KAOT1_10891 [Kordia algicida OT-1]